MENNSSSTEQRISAGDINLGIRLFEPRGEKIISRNEDGNNNLLIFGNNVLFEGTRVQEEQPVEYKLYELDGKGEKRREIQGKAEKSKEEKERDGIGE